MVDRQKALLMILLAVLISANDIFGGAFQPEIAGPIENLTVALGRDALFTCVVNHLGGYRVGWVKVDTKAIQAIHESVITQNKRISVSHSDHSTWHLKIKGVQPEDEGLYMCQINTDPMKSQVGLLKIVVPPDFIPEDTSGDIMVTEGGQVKLTCRARGIPQPRVSWRREDGRNITIRESSAGNAQNQKPHVISVAEYYGEDLKMSKISRNEMGIYLCIASNNVPPTVSKRISVSVHFPPVIRVPNQLVGAPLGTDVSLECFVAAYPKAINYWVTDKGAMIISSIRHSVQTVSISQFEVRMILTIRNFRNIDVGTYRCAAKNSLGDVESSIRLYEILGTDKKQIEFYDEEDEVIYGSAELENMENKSPAVQDNTIHGHVGFPSVATASPTVRISRKRPAVKMSSRANQLQRASPLLTLVIIWSMVCLCHRWQ
ncbi:lachesin-like [Prorops nasuta]|uniref:lachesin-like n=1 Tax=Prorops nasuta TaxID=863751 RepID=UPI0034CE2C45